MTLDSNVSVDLSDDFVATPAYESSRNSDTTTTYVDYSNQKYEKRQKGIRKKASSSKYYTVC